MKPIANTLSSTEKPFWEKLSSLNFNAIAHRLMESEAGWTKTQTQQALAQYAMFLQLVDLYPNTPLVPTGEIDRVWHHHILDTVKYEKDCQFLFGRFLHHSPGVKLHAMTDEIARSQRDLLKDSTQQLFERHFNLSLKETQFSRVSGCTIPQLCG